MQNYNSNMDSEYADLYSSYAKMQSNSVQMDPSNSVLHYQPNDLKPMELQQDFPTNSDDLEQLQMDTQTGIQTNNTEDITRSLELGYNNQVSDYNNTQEVQETHMKDECVEQSVVENEIKQDLADADEEMPPLKLAEEVPAVSQNESEQNEVKEKESIEEGDSSPKQDSDIAKAESVSETVEPPSLLDVCRVCMENTGVLISIFEDEDSVKMCEKVMNCAAVQVSRDDGLPELICHACANDVEVAYKFKKKCETSDKALREKLGVKIKTIVKTEFVLIDCDNEPIISEDEKPKRKPKYKEDDFEDDFSAVESDDPPYGSTSKKRLKKRSKRLSAKNKNKKKEIKKKKTVKEEVDDDVIEVTKKPTRKKSVEAPATPVNKYACTFCEKAFAYPSVLKLHLVTHTKEKAHKCVICTKAFTYSKELYTHYKTAHPNEYGKVMEDKSKGFPFPCLSCDKVFSLRKNLKVHEVVHLRDKKYKCEVCSQGFTNMTTLNMHKKQDHPNNEKSYKCSVCDKRFKQQAAMDRHMENHRHHSQVARIVEEKKPPSTKDLFKSIAPVTTTYWSDSFSD